MVQTIYVVLTEFLVLVTLQSFTECDTTSWDIILNEDERQYIGTYVPAAFICFIALQIPMFTAKPGEAFTYGIDIIRHAFEGLSEYKSLKSLKKLPLEEISSFLGAFGGFVSVLILFIPAEDSPELKYMMNKFAKIDQKLDLIGKKIDDMQSMFNLASQKAQYIKEENNILYGYRQLKIYMFEILRTPCSNKQECMVKRLKIGSRFKSRFDIKKSLSMIFDATYQNRIFGEPLFKLFAQHYKCDVPKLNEFANRITELGIKAQKVLLMYEKLTGSKTTILESMSTWLQGIYRVRAEMYKYEEAIYKSAEKCISFDVKNEKYQVDMTSNLHAATTLSSVLKKKYNWLDWVIISYTPGEDSEHTYETFDDGVFVNSPADKQKRKRVLIAAAQHPERYFRETDIFGSIILEMKRDKIFAKYSGKLKELYSVLKKQITDWGFMKMIQTVIIVDDKKKRDLQMTKLDNLINGYHSNYYYETVYYSWCVFKYFCGRYSVHIIAVFKSPKEVEYTGCKRTCSNKNGKCINKPYSAIDYCACLPYYQGENCESRIKTNVAKDIQKVCAIAIKIPDITDAFFEIKGLGDKLGASLGNINYVITNLETAMHKSFEKFGKHIDLQFKWGNIITIYNRPIESLK